MHCLAVLVIAADRSYACGRSLMPCLPCRSELLARAVVGVAVVRRCFRLGLRVIEGAEVATGYRSCCFSSPVVAARSRRPLLEFTGQNCLSCWLLRLAK
ncbi:hypothetical protein KY285_023973 [Solanum tuberosum]|nr:hypothetical protein KY289_024320 [Solanum tuberosum]KAH0676172.1 hypothetical protein KY285_023973 [Solanum tuberosum]